MKKGLCSSVKRKDHELTIKHIEIEKVIVPISSYKGCTNHYPIPDCDFSVLHTLDHFARKRYVRGGAIGPLKYTAIKRSISLKGRSLYKKSIGLSGIRRIIENVSIEDYR